MGKAWEIVTGRATNPGATLTAVTPGTGDSVTVRNFSGVDGGWLESMWATGATAGIARIISPRMHDTSQNLRFRYIAGGGRLLLPPSLSQRVFAQDNFSPTLSGGGAETDVMSWVNYYADISGVAGEFHTYDELAPRIVNLLTTEIALTTGATVGDYGGSAAINSLFDLLKADTNYGIFGYETDVAVHAVGVRGPDFGNLRIGGPGTTERLETRDLFIRMGMETGRPHIPVINAANKANTLIDLVHTAAGTAVNVTLIMAELRG